MSGDPDAVLTKWCAEHIGSPIDTVLFRADYFSHVVGLALSDGTRAVIKIRSAAPRLAYCAQVQNGAVHGGVPCRRAPSCECPVSRPAGSVGRGAHRRSARTLDARSVCSSARATDSPLSAAGSRLAGATARMGAVEP